MNTKRPSVLFVCTANICRSPMAMALFKAHLCKARPDWENWRIDSAGTWADDGQDIAENSARVLENLGLEVQEHQSKTVTGKLLEQFDLVLTMEPGQKEALQVEFPQVAKRVFALSEMQNQNLLVAVKDPYGKALEEYELTAGVLDRMVAKGMDRIISLVMSRHTEA